MIPIPTPPPLPPGGSTTAVTLYDFLEEKNVQSAVWRQGPPAEMALTWLGDMSSQTAEQKGYGYMRWLGGGFGNFNLEDGSVVGPLDSQSHGVMMRPKNQYYGYTSATYNMSGYTIGSKDYLLVRLGFLQGSTKGSATFQISFTPFSSATWTGPEIFKIYDGKIHDQKIWLGSPPSYIKGKPIESIQLRVTAGDSGDDDHAVWLRCQLIRE